jgi:hypothetical protein
MNALPHILVADDVRRRLQWPDWVRAHVLMGALAPDAYRIVPGLDYRALHFRYRHGVGQRLSDYLADYLRPALREGGHDEQAFRVGWLSHILSDLVWQKMLREQFPQLWGGVLGQDVAAGRQLRLEYQNACDRIDREIAQSQSEYLAEVRWTLRSANLQYDLTPLNVTVMNQWIGRVAIEALPPSAPPTPGIDYLRAEFVHRACAAGVERTVALMIREYESDTAPVSDFLDQ